MSKNFILNKILSLRDLKEFDIEELELLADEIRERIIDVTSKNGGHIASNLGMVELTIALHYVFNPPKDKILWDVSHQCYTHKLLTGRKDSFNSLRKIDGCSGFLLRGESEYDIFGAGHAGTAISAALGIAVARDLNNSMEKVIAVIGDGTLTNGVALEGLNSVSETTKDLILILNDNNMAISKNVGSIAKFLNKILVKRAYNRTKNFFKKSVLKIPKYGDRIKKFIEKLEEGIKGLIVPGTFFEELGIRYIGPIDGHNLPLLIENLEVISGFDTPVILHIITKKGKGFSPAETQPEKYHGIGKFDIKNGESIKKTKKYTFTDAFRDSVLELAQENDDIVVITPAMKIGTGLAEFAKRFPNRFFDVGIAESHAVIFAAGLATMGFRPVLAFYATFLQRSMGSFFHDVILQNLPVILCTDRSGIVEDGPTHHGIYDLAYLRSLPNISILYPATKIEMKEMLKAAYNYNGPVIIRYAKGDMKISVSSTDKIKIEWGMSVDVKSGNTISIWATGNEVGTAIEVAKILNSEWGISANVVNVRFLKPFDREKLIKYAYDMIIVSIEDNQISGGLASTIDEILINCAHKGVLHFGWRDEIIPHGSPDDLRNKYNMDAKSIAIKINNAIKDGRGKAHDKIS